MPEELPLPEEKAPEVPSLGPEGLPEGATPKPEEKGPAFGTEPEKIMDAMTFWSSIAAQTSVHIVAPIDAPTNVGESMAFNGKIVFKEFPKSGQSFSGEAKRINAANAPGPAVALVLPVSGIMAAVANVIKEYTARGNKLGGLIRLAEESLPVIFGHVFAAIKEKSEGLYWTGGTAKEHGGRSIPLVSYIYDPGLDQDLGVNLYASFDGMKAKINEQAERVLAGGGKGTKTRKEKSPLLHNRTLLLNFVLHKIPADKFKPTAEGMLAGLTMEEVEALGGKEVVEAIKATPKTGAEGWQEGGDVHTFWYRYNASKGTVVFENRRLTDKKTLKEIQTIWGKYGGGTPQDLFRAIAGDKGVSMGTVVHWFSTLADRLTPDIGNKVKSIFGLGTEEEGIKKVAYPNQPWAGPTLEQVGALVGLPQAKWASELAGNLAAKFDYISFPKLEGGPSDLKKLASLPLTEEQSARVEKYRELSAQLMNDLVTKLFHNLSKEKPHNEEIVRLAEDILLNLVEETPSKMSDEEFKKLLNDSIRMIGKALQAHPSSTMPSTRVSPEDVMQGDEPSYDVVRETPEEEPVEASLKVKAFTKDDAVQVAADDRIDPRLRGQMGTVKGAMTDIFLCPKHGPEPVIRYLVEIPNEGLVVWMTDDELLPAGSVN